MLSAGSWRIIRETVGAVGDTCFFAALHRVKSSKFGRAIPIGEIQMTSSELHDNFHATII